MGTADQACSLTDIDRATQCGIRRENWFLAMPGFKHRYSVTVETLRTLSDAGVRKHTRDKILTKHAQRSRKCTVSFILWAQNEVNTKCTEDSHDRDEEELLQKWAYYPLEGPCDCLKSRERVSLSEHLSKQHYEGHSLNIQKGGLHD
jgi:hypothetical protein